jgi:hypothetical protein
MFGSFPPSPLVVCASKVYSGLGADIVIESLRSSAGARLFFRRPQCTGRRPKVSH